MKLLTYFKGNNIVLPFAFFALLLVLASYALSNFYTSRYVRESGASLRVHNLLRDLEVNMMNAENSRRGILLHQKDQYLPPFKDIEASIAQTWPRLRQAYATHPNSLTALAELQELTSSRLREIAQSSPIEKHQWSDAALMNMLEGGDQAAIERMRTIAGDLAAREKERLVAAQGRLQHTLLTSYVGFALLSLLCWIAVLLYLRINTASKTEQLELQRVIALERDQLSAVAAKRTQELVRLASYLHRHREDERSRLARNLHDDLGALLTSAKLDAARIKSRVQQSSPEVAELLAHLVGNLNSSISLGRKIIEDLRPSALSNLGLVATLQIFAREFEASSDLLVHSSFEEVDLPADSQLMVYRLMQEACTNILKYAKASNVWLQLGMQDEVIVASVRDDGVGFDTDQRLAASYGLLGMRYRVEAAQGVLNIISSPGNGTLVQALL